MKAKVDTALIWIRSHPLLSSLIAFVALRFIVSDVLGMTNIRFDLIYASVAFLGSMVLVSDWTKINSELDSKSVIVGFMGGAATTCILFGVRGLLG